MWLLVALASSGCARVPEPSASEPEARSVASAAVPASAPARADAAPWESLQQRDVAMLGRRFGGTPAPLPVPPVPAPADVLHAPADALRTPHGTRYVILARSGAAETHHPWDDVDVRYTMWSRAGMTSTSRAFGREDFSAFQAETLPPEWAEVLARLHVGDRARLWYAVGERAEPMLADVALLQVRARPEPPPVPGDVAGPPAEAIHEADGTAYVVRKGGSSGRPLSETDDASATLTAWTTDGVRFYSSRGAPVDLLLPQLPRGLRSALLSQKEGAELRLWIPAAAGRMAFQAVIPRWPIASAVVLDVTLKRIVPRSAGPGVP